MAKPDEKKKCGKPLIVFDAAKVKQVEKLAAVLSKAQICDYFGVCNDTFRSIEKRQPEVGKAFAQGKSKAIVSVANNLINQARKGSTSAAIFYLKTRAGWVEPKPEDETNGVAQPLTINFEVSEPVKDVKITNADT
tara:strand:- start:7 stop:414 length:408 start_codon:yes stop_codon:yes gene_type:complete